MNSTSDQPEIRRAHMRDAKALKNCIDRAYSSAKARLPDLPDVSAGLREDIADKVVFVAETSGLIAGVAILGIENGNAHLANIAVDPGQKGKGIGKALMETVQRFAKQQGATELRLATHVGMPENVSLYTHLGWHETSRTGNKILMAKKL
ncbi:GNAT family N-acetyltransferase [Roseibium sp. SCP14]|uniref:GNAT family N-acetyltransferase n=1 Tax=Roseibium sp. SCP14 TaxID=3141375 RepID=UPI003337C79A